MPSAVGILDLVVRLSSSDTASREWHAAATSPHSQPATPLAPTLPVTPSSPSATLISPSSPAPSPTRTAGMAMTLNQPVTGSLI